MTGSVTERDLRKVVDLVERGRQAEPHAGMPPIVLESLHELIGCDELSFVDLDPEHSQTLVLQEVFEDEPPADVAEPGGESDVEDKPFWAHYWDCRSCSYPSVTGDNHSITTLSDFYSSRQWHNTAMYAEHLRGVEHRAMVCLSAPQARSRRLLLFRRSGHDFDERERLLLWLLRPHLNELYQDLARRKDPGPSLTIRQRQLLSLVARGLSNKEIARELALSAQTVRTHLENIFRRLDVTNRSAAVAKFFRVPPY